MSEHAHAIEGQSDRDYEEFLTVMIANQKFGIPILQIQDVLRVKNVTKTPLAPPEVAGSLNLRGSIVTAIDVKNRLNMDIPEDCDSNMSVVVENENELYSLVIDRVGDVLKLENKDFEKNPATLDPLWQDISMGIYRLDDELLVILDVPKLLGSIHN